MKYWQVYSIIRGQERPEETWSIEYEDGTYLTIAKRDYESERGRGWISRSTTFPIDKRSKWSTKVLKEVSKESVMEALKTVLETLDLPQEINILKHKF